MIAEVNDIQDESDSESGTSLNECRKIEDYALESSKLPKGDNNPLGLGDGLSAYLECTKNRS